ncbi:MAG TPA: hypothetical protein VFB67_06450 [Candidatus Polarisedimenticolaceae bacterium]|nr:hypothetical protein [Candidatus Polarisedimenticolaceae bacterium]
MTTKRLLGGAVLVLLAAPAALAQTAPRLDEGVLSGLGIRNIGSAAMSGRIAAVAAARKKSGETVLYVGAASGGVWRSTDGGTTFLPKFDHESVQSIGAIEIDPGNPDTVWVGTGEAWTRNSVSIGDGIYRSTDGGETWTNMGLPESERIVKIAVDPGDGKVVYACATGKLWSDSSERGVYRTRDGGKSWTLVLKGSNPSTGCGGMSMDAKHPSTLFASLWDFRRKGWTFRSGGATADAPSGSGLFRTDDGGEHWTEITDAKNAGFPAKPYGRVAVAVAPSHSDVVYAVVESVKSALYRSGDGGKTWERRDDSQNMVWRPFYFANLIVDPTNPDRLFKPDGDLIQSLDGGKTFSSAGGGAHGDFHDLWIDPNDPKQVVTGDDGGLWFSKDGGNRWWKGNNLRSRSSTTSAWTTRIRTACTAACRTTAPGSATRPIPAGSPTPAGRTCTAATASGCSPTRATPTTCTPRPREARSDGSTGARTSRATSSRARGTARSCAGTGTRRSTSRRTSVGRSTSARSSSSGAATTVRPGTASPRT